MRDGGWGGLFDGFDGWGSELVVRGGFVGVLGVRDAGCGEKLGA